MWHFLFTLTQVWMKIVIRSICIQIFQCFSCTCMLCLLLYFQEAVVLDDNCKWFGTHCVPESTIFCHHIGMAEDSMANPLLTSGSPNKKWFARRCCYGILGILLFLVLLGAVGVFVALMMIVGGQPPRVHTHCGMVEGKYDMLDDMFTFKVSQTFNGYIYFQTLSHLMHSWVIPVTPECIRWEVSGNKLPLYCTACTYILLMEQKNQKAVLSRKTVHNHSWNKLIYG